MCLNLTKGQPEVMIYSNHDVLMSRCYTPKLKSVHRFPHFSTSVFGVGILFLIAPFPDHCPLVPFHEIRCEWFLAYIEHGGHFFSGDLDHFCKFSFPLPNLEDSI